METSLFYVFIALAGAPTQQGITMFTNIYETQMQCFVSGQQLAMLWDMNNPGGKFIWVCPEGHKLADSGLSKYLELLRGRQL